MFQILSPQIMQMMGGMGGGQPGMPPGGPFMPQQGLTPPGGPFMPPGGPFMPPGGPGQQAPMNPQAGPGGGVPQQPMPQMMHPMVPQMPPPDGQQGGGIQSALFGNESGLIPMLLKAFQAKAPPRPAQ